MRGSLDYTIGKDSFTKKEFQKLLSVVDSLTDEVLLKLAVTTGLRRTDISKILIKNIDFKNQRLTYFEHKKDKWRTIPLNPSVIKLLKMYINTLRDQKYLFYWGRSKWGDRTAHRRLNNLCEKAGVRKRPFHALRATCIKFCKEAGWTPAETAELVGDTIRTIQEHYETPSDDEMKEIVEQKPIL